MAESTAAETLQIRSSEDVVRVRRLVRARALEMGFSIIDQTKIVTAASEIARNAVSYAGNSIVEIVELYESERRGLRLSFRDKGPGIADVDQAMRDGFTTSDGLGLGLGGSRRLVDEFQIHSEVGKGTDVVLTKWRPER